MKSKEPSYWTLSQQTQAVGARTTGGLGSKEMKKNLTNITKLKAYPHPLGDRVGEEVTQKHLNKPHISTTDSKAGQNQGTHQKAKG